MCKTPQIAAQIALLPIERYGKLLDAAILFSDILIVLMGVGYEVLYDAPCGITLQKPLAFSHEEVNEVCSVSDGEFLKNVAYTFEAIRQTKQMLPPETPLIGFAASPWTLFWHAVEASSRSETSCTKNTKQSAEAVERLYSDASLCKAYLEAFEAKIVCMLHAQIAAGADVKKTLDHVIFIVVVLKMRLLTREKA